MAEKAEASPSHEKTSPAGGSKVALGLTALNSLLLVAVVALLAIRLPAPSAAKAAVPEAHAGQGPDAAASPSAADASASAPKPMLQLPDFVVHLRDPDADRYARLTLNVELRAEQDKETVNSHMPQLRDAFLAYLSDRTVEELRGSDGMALVKQDLAKKLNEIVPSAPVKALYVTELVVQ